MSLIETLDYFSISTVSDSNRVVFLESKLSPNGGGIIWASKNSGHNFTHHALPSGVVIDDVTFHPTKADWMLGYDRLKRNLYISTDFAASWHLLDTGVSPSRYETNEFTIQFHLIIQVLLVHSRNRYE